ncbi:hypothetical protein BDY24DRAFT_401821 [Mrakia frigida]|uniref:uncharacterized protein n=1 Tax=Mrakia frigida TaxID=29902 RepID=UPI003FCC0C15
MELMTKEEQFALAGRTTVMLGVHGNGLTHQLWMDPTPFSTVIEIFIDQGLNYDYALPAQVLGHKHYALWSDGAGKVDVLDTVRDHPPINWPDEFHGTNIRVDGPTVVNVIEERLQGWRASV